MKLAKYRPNVVMLTILFLALLAGCASSIKYDSDFMPGYNFASVASIAWLPDRGKMTGDSPLAAVSDIQRQRVDAAFERALTAKGIKLAKLTDDADLLLTWHLVTQDKTDVRTTITPNRGLYDRGTRGYDRAAQYNCWNCGATDVTVREYTMGSLIVDLIDPKMNKSVWRGVLETEITGRPERDQDAINEIAEKLFAPFPPAP